ncbi:MAG: histidine kinase [Deltaproteobacteria bacterium]|jgi:signal transduction histidine kinase|nr:histidine kinase [Deltaproteobacteria bacterium]MCL5880827.1 histidine kinase [Deltaproteobacteria bacterium]MDA8304293.1 histidine kinase [Deltaproteobacteria bacterium]
MRFPLFFSVFDIFKRFYNVSLRIKVIGLVIFATLILGLPVIYFVNRDFSQQNNMQLRLMSNSIGKQLSSQSVNYILEDNIYALTRLLKNSLKNDPDVVYAFIQNKRGEVIASTFNGGFPAGLLKVNDFKPKGLSTVKIKTNKGMIYDTSAPILEGRLGSVRVGISSVRSNLTLYSLIRSIFFSMIFAAVLAIILSGAIAWWVMAPIVKLSEAVNIVKNGSYDVKLDVKRDDEIGKLTNGFNEMVNSLKKANSEQIENDNLRKNFITNVIKAQEEERKRIARDLHDQFAQLLAYIKIRFGLLKDLNDFKEARSSIIQISEDLTKALDLVRDIAKSLMPGILDEMGLVCAASSYIDDINKKSADFKVDFYTGGSIKDKRFHPNTEINVYRIIQEALSNVILHSQTNYAKISLEEGGGKIRGAIEDYGIGFKYDIIKKDSFGIFGMIERAKLLGGDLEIESLPGKGTAVKFWVPAAQITKGN